ncbi:Dyp-type peroxidase [Nonomuraea longicatena]|uniref:Iron uptake transporter deferrochelatase/peroxidase subunit n=1 Tax=Nonomuraea longicatena TaxID=83682 RepID=A0ABN1P3U8_9ACTN
MAKIGRRHALAAGGLAALGVLTAGDEESVRAQDTGHLRDVLLPPREHLLLTALDVSRADAYRTLAHLIATRDEPVAATLALGASWFAKTGRTDLPTALTAMPVFEGDVLDAGLSHGDLLLQLTASSADLAQRVRDRWIRQVPGSRVRWERRGFQTRAGTAPEGRPLTRNHFGFVEGHTNPPRQSLREVVEIGPGAREPAWAIGGTYQVVRIIRFATEFWNEDPVPVQERVMGRRRDGTWLDGSPATGHPRFSTDPHGLVTPLDSHARRANPREPGTEAPRMLRRGYTYRQSATDEGMLFIAFQADMERGFAGVQRRLAGQALDRYVLTVGGGYFFVPDPARLR